MKRSCVGLWRPWSIQWLLLCSETLFFPFPPSAVVPQLQVSVLDRSVCAEQQLPHRGHPSHSQMVASSACLSLWTPVFWVLVPAFQAETPLL